MGQELSSEKAVRIEYYRENELKSRFWMNVNVVSPNAEVIREGMKAHLNSRKFEADKVENINIQIPFEEQHSAFLVHRLIDERPFWFCYADKKRNHMFVFIPL